VEEGKMGSKRWGAKGIESSGETEKIVERDIEVT